MDDRMISKVFLRHQDYWFKRGYSCVDEKFKKMVSKYPLEQLMMDPKITEQDKVFRSDVRFDSIRPPIVNYDSGFNVNTGYGSAAINNVLSLLKTGLIMKISGSFQFTKYPMYNNQYRKLDSSSDFVIEHYPPFIKYEGDVIYTVHEIDAIPAHWIKTINKGFKELWVPSKHTKSLFQKNGVVIPITIVPHSLDKNEFRPDHWPLVFSSKSYKFLFIGHWMERKNPYNSLKAYLKAFTIKDDVVLYIRAFIKCGSGDAKADVDQAINQIVKEEGLSEEQMPRVQLIDEIQTQFIPNLYASIDCLYDPVRCEGFGIPLIEAMATGKPIITSDWPAMNELVTPDVGYLVKCKPALMSNMEWANESYSMNDNALWAEPDIDHLIETLRYVYNHQNEAALKGMVGRSKFLESYTHETTGPIMKGRILDMLFR